MNMSCYVNWIWMAEFLCLILTKLYELQKYTELNVKGEDGYEWQTGNDAEKSDHALL
jgi:hypothetical protein